MEEIMSVFWKICQFEYRDYSILIVVLESDYQDSFARDKKGFFHFKS